MWPVVSWLGFETEIGHPRFKLASQAAEVFGRVLDAHPQGPGTIEIRERPRPAKEELEWWDVLADLVKSLADIGDLDVFDIAQEFQCQVQVVRGNPLDPVPRFLESVDQPHGGGADVGREGDGNEGSD